MTTETERERFEKWWNEDGVFLFPLITTIKELHQAKTIAERVWQAALQSRED